MSKNEMKMPFLVVAGLTATGITAFIITICFYVFSGNFSNNLSSNNADWGAFGSFLGGVMSPVIGLFSVIFLGFNLLAQQFQLNQQFKESLKQEMLRLLNDIQREFDSLFKKQVIVERERTVEFGDIVDGLEIAEPMERDRYLILLKKLRVLIERYHEALMLYQDNTEVQYGFKALRERLNELQSFVEKNSEYFSKYDQLNINIARGFQNQIDKK